MTALSHYVYPSQSLLWGLIMAITKEEIDAMDMSADKALFKTIYSHYSTLVDKVCFTFASNRNDYDDLRQDAWLNIWRGIESFRGESKPSTWIYRVAINSCVSTVRSTRRHGRNASIDEATGFAAESTESDGVQRIHYLLSQLNPIDRSIMLLRLEERDYEEIADIMGMPRNTIASRLRRIRIKLSQLNNRKDI